MQLVRIEINIGNCPSSLMAAKLQALELTPKTYLQNLILTLSNSQLLFKEMSNISSKVLLL